jgi:hypothetical protein
MFVKVVAPAEPVPVPVNVNKIGPVFPSGTSAIRKVNMAKTCLTATNDVVRRVTVNMF